ncbi:sugar kinase [soil metagenome]
MTRVLVLGDVNMDVVAVLAAAIQPGTDTPAAIRCTAGGAGANVASWLASLGVDVTLIGRVGDDDAGRRCIGELNAVRTVLSIDPDAPTGSVVVLVDPTGERSMLCDRGANLRLTPGDLPAELFQAGAHLHLSGYTLLHERPRPAALRALTLARVAGMTISVDPASTAPLAAYGPDRFRAETTGADLLLPNLAEARLLSGVQDPAGAAWALASGYGAVVVSCGADGAVWAAGEETGRAAAEPLEVVDTTGAGDAFTAGLLAAWLDSTPLSECVWRATRTAARAVTGIGAGPG